MRLRRHRPWLAGSILFSWYVSNVGKYNETNGSLGVVIALHDLALAFGHAEMDQISRGGPSLRDRLPVRIAAPD